MFVVVFPTPGGELYSLGEILAEVTSNGGIIDWKLMSGGIWPEGVGFTPAANRYCSPLKVELTRLFTVRSMMIYGFPAGSDENKIRLEYSENNRLAERFKPANVVLYADN